MMVAIFNPLSFKIEGIIKGLTLPLGKTIGGGVSGCPSPKCSTVQNLTNVFTQIHFVLSAF